MTTSLAFAASIIFRWNFDRLADRTVSGGALGPVTRTATTIEFFVASQETLELF